MTATHAPAHRRQLAARDSRGRWTTREVPVGSILRAAVRRWGDRPAFIDHDVAAHLHRAGPPRARGRRLAGRPRRRPRGRRRRPHSPTAGSTRRSTTAILLAGATFSPTNPLLPAPDLAAQLTDAGATRADHLGPGAARSSAARWPPPRCRRSSSPARRTSSTSPRGSTASRTATSTLADLLAADPTDRHLDADLDPAADLAHLAYTGGTTGVSKGVELPHRNVVTNVLQSACWTSGSVPELDDGRRRHPATRSVGAEEYPTRLGQARRSST